MSVKTFVVNNFQENTYIYFDSESREAVLIDPGAYYENEFEYIKSFIDSNNLIVKYILLTHGHIDHILSVNYFRNLYNIESYMHSGDTKLIDNILEYSEMFGFTLDSKPVIDNQITKDTKIKIGNSELRFLHTPGHSHGGVCIIDDKNKIVFTGDLIFRDSIGRTDLPGGDFDTIIKSIKDILFSECDDSYILYPGHLSDTTVYQEKHSNRFLI
ncbi:MAG TPA: MBL fold metallo-hydrolase [Ignavibacteria bacterium]|nr:MBL fold metallo-hydrolase [Ignavibacteria bacterium]